MRGIADFLPGLSTADDERRLRVLGSLRAPCLPDDNGSGEGQQVHYLLLMFFSSMFYPLTDLPIWFRAAAYLNPMTWQVDVLRFSLLGVGAPATLMLEWVALGIFTVICLAFAVRALNRAG